MKATDLNRRSFLRGKSPQFNAKAIYPPWALPTSQFIDICTRCDACINACPEKIIFRGDGGYPEMDFKQGACTFCARCVDICETKAFHDYQLDDASNESYLNADDAWQLSVKIKPECLSLNAIVCRICGENCDEDAIQFRLQLGGVSTPLIDNDSCTGCGECLFVCPENAISIKPSNS